MIHGVSSTFMAATMALYHSLLLQVVVLAASASLVASMLSWNESSVFQFALVVSESEDTSSFYGGGSVNESLSAVDIALQHVSSCPDIPWHTNLIHVFTKCEQDEVIKLAFEEIMNGPYQAVLGTGCSRTITAISTILRYWNIPQITYSPILNTANEDGLNIVQLQLSPKLFSSMIIGMMRYFQWNRLFILSSNASLYKMVEADVSMTLRNRNITVNSSTLQGRTDDVAVLVDQEIRIVFLNMDMTNTVWVLCKAYKLGMVFPKYVWITYYIGDFNTSVDCPNVELHQYVHGVLAMDSTFITSSRNTKRVDCLNSSMEWNLAPHTRLAYDAVWMLALALNHSLRTTGNADCGDGRMASEQGSCFNASGVPFRGLSGDVVISSSTGERKADLINFFQYRWKGEALAAVQVATVNVSSLVDPYINNGSINTTTIFDGYSPSDGRPMKEVTLLPVPLLVVYDLLATLGVLFAIVCLTFNIIYRKRKIVRLTSPNLNYFIIAGALCIYMSVYIRFYVTSNVTYHNVRCNVQAILGCLGYVLCFGPVLVKMWRVYYIFHNPSPRKKAIKDWHLAVVVGVLVGIIAVMVILSAAVPPLRPDIELSEDQGKPHGRTDDGIRIVYCALECYSEMIPYLWLALEYGYLFVLQIIALFLAFKTRKVKIKVLNDSKSVSAIIYVTSIVMVALVIITFTLDTYIVLAEAMFSAGLIIATTTFLAFSFVPKMHALSKDPEGEQVLNSTAQAAVTTTQTAVTKEAGSKDTEANGNDQTVEQLLLKVKKLESEILLLKGHAASESAT